MLFFCVLMHHVSMLATSETTFQCKNFVIEDNKTIVSELYFTFVCLVTWIFGAKKRNWSLKTRQTKKTNGIIRQGKMQREETEDEREGREWRNMY